MEGRPVEWMTLASRTQEESLSSTCSCHCALILFSLGACSPLDADLLPIEPGEET